MSNDLKKVEILGVRVTVGSREEVVGWLRQKLMSESRFVRVVTPNPEQVVQAKGDKKFGKVLNGAEVAICDGVGLVWAAKKLSVGGLERIAGVEMAEELVRYCGENGLKVMIVGGKLSRAEQVLISKSKFLNKSKIQNAKYQIKYLPGAEDIKRETREEKEWVLGEITGFGPDLLLVAYGAPWQEKWVYDNRGHLENSGVRVAMVVGGAVDYWAGKVGRAPGFVRDAGLEWLWRLVREPWRMGRQLRLVQFVGMVVRDKLV